MGETKCVKYIGMKEMEPTPAVLRGVSLRVLQRGGVAGGRPGGQLDTVAPAEY